MSSNFKYDLSRNLKKYVKFIPQLTKPVLRVLIQVSVHYIESARCPPDPLDLALTKLSQTGCEVPENFHELFACIIRIIKLFLRTRKGYVKEEELRECLKELKFTDDCIDDFVKVLLNHRDSLTQNYCEINNLIFSPPKRLQWCINLTLVDSGVLRIAQPTIVFNILQNGTPVETFEVPINMFHRLRYTIACLLKEFQILENRQIMRK